MKISASPTSDNYWRNLLEPGQDIVVYLDGVEVPHVVAADDEAGVVMCQKYGGDGHPVYAGGRYIYDTKTGKVEIKIVDKTP